MRSGTTDDTSATWRIVEVWANDADDDGIPFRDKIYAVFPGFEPSLSDGSRGVHLLFLFDPEIGRDCFLRAFQAVMQGTAPWASNQLRNTPLSTEQVFDALDRLRRDEGDRSGGAPPWDFMCLAPHAFGEKGLFDLRGQIMYDFPSERLAGIELGDNTLPVEQIGRRAWLGPAMSQLGHAFFHGSDAYALSEAPLTPGTLYELGSRVTLVKLASPRLEALRQAFLSSDSRVQIAYERRDGAQELVLRADLPDPLATARPWLRDLTVRGGASFFGGRHGDSGADRSTTFRFSPDLTCVIGSRMSGKSTLLDGLRLHFQAATPRERRVHEDVHARGQRLAAGASVVPEVRGRSDPTAGLIEQWPAQFFTQRELQEAVRDQAGLRQILFHLLPGRSGSLVTQHERLVGLDAQLREEVEALASQRNSLLEAEQSFERAREAKVALERYAAAGAARLDSALRDAGVLRTFATSTRSVADTAQAAATAAMGLTPPSIGDPALAALLGEAVGFPLVPSAAAEPLRGGDDTAPDITPDSVPAEPISSPLFATQSGLTVIKATLRAAAEQARALANQLSAVADSAEQRVATLRVEIQQALVEAGGTADELFQFERRSGVAATYERVQAELARRQSVYSAAQTALVQGRDARAALVVEHRQAMAEVLAAIGRRFAGKIRLRVLEGAELEPLDSWVRGLREAAITRWWTEESADDRRPTPTPERILAALHADDLQVLGMSQRLGQRFKELMDEARRLDLIALRTADRYVLELHVGPGADDYRAMARLSGGQQVSVLLSLLLESDDPRPLVIDQPEDELDSGYLFDTVLPALRRLKGGRQIIFATHNPNIVVNGDADHVIHLSATADHGDIAAQGAIEQPDVKAAILNTVDGGRAAFKLRQAKYGF